MGFSVAQEVAASSKTVYHAHAAIINSSHPSNLIQSALRGNCFLIQKQSKLLLSHKKSSSKKVEMHRLIETYTFQMGEMWKSGGSEGPPSENYTSALFPK